ncbi:trichohyalin-like [Mercenaria mercenaria]|uniref:trichohyalin-like n=1 Tax=Mercenaria mercenaria TaxID=6596 RepID=UPI00234EBA22|nr:trichohyalin-like [Mercenaria mercenaria]
MAEYMSERELRKIERNRRKEEDRLKRQNARTLEKEEKRKREQSEHDKKEREQIELQKQRERLIHERRKLKEKSKLLYEMEKGMKERERVDKEIRQKSKDIKKDFESDSSETEEEFKELEQVDSDHNSSIERKERSDKTRKYTSSSKENLRLKESEITQSRRAERKDSSDSEYSDLDKSTELQVNARQTFSEERMKKRKGSVLNMKDEVSFRNENPLSSDSLEDKESEIELDSEQSESDASEDAYTTVDQIYDVDYIENPRHNSTEIETEENKNVNFENEMRWLDEKWQQYQCENAELKSSIDKLRNTETEKENIKRDRNKHLKYTAAEDMLKEKIKQLKIREKRVNDAIQENRMLKQKQAEELDKLKHRQTEAKRESEKRKIEKDKLKKLKDEELLLKQRIKEKEARLLNENRTNAEINENKTDTRKANKSEKTESTKAKLHKPNIPSLTETTFEEWKIEVEIILKSGLYEENILRQAIRNSLCGHTRKILLTMSPDATIQQIINKLEGIYGNIRSGESVLSEFYMSKQGKDENVSEWGLRLESILQRAIEKGHIKEEQREDMLKTRFWRHLYSEDLKNATRLSFETSKSFEELRRKVRIEENEMSMTRIQEVEIEDKISLNQHKSEDDSDIVMKTVLERMKRLEEELLRVQEKRHDIEQERSRWDRRDRYRDRYDRGNYRNRYRDYEYGDRRNYKRDYRERYDTDRPNRDYRRRYDDIDWRKEDDRYPRYRRDDIERGYRGDRRTNDRYGNDRERNYDVNSCRDQNEKYRESDSRRDNKEFDRNDREGSNAEQRKQDTDKGDTAKQEHKQVQSNSKTEAAGRTNTPNKPLNR